MKTYVYAANASRLHRKIGEILSTEQPWTGFKGKQEVLVSDLFPEFEGRERYDWVIPDLFAVIECHGIQHYKVQTFGQEVGDAIMNFELQKTRDARKKEVALLNNWTYIEIPYTDEKELNGDYLWTAYKANEVDRPPVVAQDDRRSQWGTDDQKARAKEYRHQQYLRAKALKEKIKRGNN